MRLASDRGWGYARSCQVELDVAVADELPFAIFGKWIFIAVAQEANMISILKRLESWRITAKRLKVPADGTRVLCSRDGPFLLLCHGESRL